MFKRFLKRIAKVLLSVAKDKVKGRLNDSH